MQLRFGISMVVCEGWLEGIFYNTPPVFNEEFIGAYSNIEGFPHLMADIGLGSLLDTRYPRMFIDTTHVMNGLNEVGVGTRTTFSAPLYLYLSKDGDLSFFHGKVCGVIQQLGDMRTSCFMFTPLCLDPAAMTQVFEIIMPWLSAKFEETGKAVVLDVPRYESAFASIEERRSRIQDFLDYVQYQATDEEKRIYGMQDLKPFVVEGD
jgi:hypothetical protein